MTDLHHHLGELVVVGFNWGKYDVNVLKDILIPHLVHRSGIDLTIKRHHTYLALRTSALKFMNISNFVVGGTSYGAFLKAYQCQGEKGFFPHEHVRSLSQLEELRIGPARGLPLLVEEERVERRRLRRLPESLERERHANPPGLFGLVQ